MVSATSNNLVNLPAEPLRAQAAPVQAAETSQVTGLDKKVTSDQIHAQLSGVAGLAQPPQTVVQPQLSPEQVLTRRQISDNLHDHLVKASGARHDERSSKRGYGRDLAKTNTNIRKSQKYMIRAVRDVRVAGITGRMSPEAAKRSINGMVNQTTSYTNMMRPQLSLMGRVNASNTRIRESAEREKSAVSGALGRLQDGQERLDLESEAYANESGTRFDREEGKFEMAETRSTLSNALKLVDEAVEGMRETLDSMQRKLTPKEEGYQRKQLARLNAKYGEGDATVPAPEPEENRKNVRLNSELVAFATLEKTRQLLQTDFREAVAMESYVA